MTVQTTTRIRSRAGLLLATASTLSLLAAVQSAHGQQVINGTTVSVPADQASPWALPNGLTVGSTGTGELDISAGGIVTTTAGCGPTTIGASTGSNGTVDIGGAGSKLNTSSCLFLVGRQGYGQVTAHDGAALTSTGVTNLANLAGSTGIIDIESGSSWSFSGLTIGQTGAGRVYVFGGSTATQGACSTVLLGVNSGASGQLNIGSGGHFSNGGCGIDVGIAGAGSIALTSGGVLDQVGQITLARDTATTQGGFTINNSQATTAADVVVGQMGKGFLQISAGGKLTDLNGIISDLTGSDSDATVTGAGSTWTNTGNLTVGRQGRGTLAIADGGVVTSKNGFYGDGPTGQITIKGAGSRWTASGDITGGTGATFGIALSDGGQINDVNGSVGGGTGQHAVTITGAGTKWTNTGAFKAGTNNSNVSIDIANGGQLTDATADIQGGIITVKGAGSTWATSGAAKVGSSGSGTLYIQDGGAVTVGGVLTLAGSSSSNGRVIIGAPSGNAPVAPGTLQAGSIMMNTGLGGSADLIFNHTSTNYEFVTNVASSATGVNLITNLAGTTILKGTNTNTGGLAVKGGKVMVNGSQTGSITVYNGGALGGSGTAGASLDVLDGARLIGQGGQTLSTGLLTLHANSNIDVTLGAPSNTALFNVGSQLTLDGNLNITNAGGFGVGIYRLFNYNTLVDNGLTITTTGGAQASDLSIQTGNKQVNLVYAGAATAVQYWDGAGTTADSAIGGGAGTWKLGPTNWTNGSGAANSAWGGGFALFTATPGVVTIDNSAGDIIASGLQFAVDGYKVGGGTLTLKGNDAAIRVGDGTANGANMTATVDAVIAGTDGLSKTDLGVLVLTGANTYSAGTQVSAGVLSVSSDGNLGVAGNVVRLNGGTLRATSSFATSREIAVRQDSNIEVMGGQVLTIDGGFSENRALIKKGAGRLLVNHAEGFSGAFGVLEGELTLNSQTFGASVVVGPTGTLSGSGQVENVVYIQDGGTWKGVVGQTFEGNDVYVMPNAVIDVTLGAPSTQALFAAYHDLALGGHLNIHDGGGFGAGLYRLFDYAGTLNYTGLSIDTVPAGVATGDLSIQTSVAHQVNLIYAAPTTPAPGMQFWNGVATSPDGSVHGGAGTWSKTPTNWTDAAGATATGWAGGQAIFSGAAGAVGIDNAAGQVSADAIQFASNGYLVSGGDLALTGGGVIRVGDGTSAGAGYRANIASAVTGASGLEKTDLGTLTLGGANTYTGGTRISGGAVQVSSDGNLGAASGGLTFNGGTLAAGASFTSGRTVAFQADGGIETGTGVTLSLTGTQSGAGGLYKTGAGTLRLMGDGAAWTGPVNLQGGLLAVNGTLGGVVTASTGTRLQGTGAVGGVVLQSGATLAPGNSIGTMTVNGDVQVQAGSLYEVELNASGASDQVHAIGKVQIQGGQVSALPAAGTYALGTRYAIVTADAGLSGTFAGLTKPALSQPFLTFGLAYDARHAFLDVVRNGVQFCSVAATKNQCASANTADSLSTGNLVYQSVANSVDAATARASFDALSGEIYASARGAQVEDSQRVRSAVFSRLDEVESARPGVWGQVFDARGRTDSDGNAARLDRSAQGLFLGGDVAVSEKIRLGLAAGYVSSDLAATARNSAATDDVYSFAAYGSAVQGRWSGRFGVALDQHDLSASRAVAIPGVSNVLKGDVRSRATQVFGEVAYRTDVKSFGLSPFVGLAHVSLDADAFAEQGGVAALKGAGGSQSLTLATAGVRGQGGWTSGKTRFDLGGSLAWRGAYGDVEPSARLGFVVAGATSTILGAPIAKDSLLTSADLGVALSPRSRLALSYAGQWASTAREQSLKASLHVSF